MPAEDLVTIWRFGHALEASMAQSMLESHGITGIVVGSELNNMLWKLGPTIAGAELQVPALVAPQAVEILREFYKTQRPATGRNWFCPRCGEEIEADFEVCWSCGATMDETGVKHPTPLPQFQLAEPIDHEDGEPFEPAPSADELAHRALKSAVIGTALFPLLFYALYLLIRVSGQDLSRRGVIKYYAATAIVLLMFAAIVGFLRG